jgi:hypothetical protein
MREPYSIFFFPNGMTAVLDKEGKQIPKYQGRHSEAIAALKADGFDWMTLPNVNGVPNQPLYA